MPNFDPAQPLPPEQEPTVQTVPVAPNQVGGFVGGPSPADPYQDAVASAEASANAQRNLAQFATLHPGMQGNVFQSPAPSPPPVQTVAPIPSPTMPSEIPQQALPQPVQPPVRRPVAPATTQAPATPQPSGPGVVAGAAKEVGEAGKEQIAATQAAGVDQQKAADALAAQEQANAAAIQAKLAEQEAARKEAKGYLDEARRKRDNFKYHDFMSDQSAGRRILIGVGVLLGNIGRDPNATNEALKIVQDNINRDFKRQQEEHKAAFQAVEQAQGDYSQLSAAHAREIAQALDLNAAKLKAVIAQSEAMAAKSKNAVGVAEVRKLNAKLGLEAAQLTDESERAALAAAEKRRLDNSTIKLQASESAKNDAQAEHLRAEAGNAKTKGVEEFVAKNAKNLYPQLPSAIKSVQQLDEAKSLREMLTSNPSALTGKLAQETLAKIAVGGTRPSIALFNALGESGGTWADITEDKLSKALTGKNSQKVRQAFIRSVDDLIREKESIVAGHRAKAERALSGISGKGENYKTGVGNYLGGVFGEPAAKAEPQWKPITPALAAKLPGKREVLVNPDGSISGAR